MKELIHVLIGALSVWCDITYVLISHVGITAMIFAYLGYLLGRKY